MVPLLEDSPTINEIAGLLNQVAPARLSEIAAEFPECRHLLTVGTTLGRPKDTASAGDSTELRRVQFLIKMAQAGIDEARPIADRCSLLAHDRLLRAMKLEVTAQAIALLAGAGTIFLVLYFGKDTRTIVAAIASFAGNLLLTGVTYYRTGLSGGRNALTTVHAKLVGAVPELDFLRGRLGSLAGSASLTAGNAKEVAQLVARAEQLCKEVRVQAAEIPGGLCKTSQ